jgi:NADP-dependent 3-hydroxy acid dehydrogenase YdfG
MKENKSIKTVLITGGSSGVGLATAKRFLAAGVDVMITGRNPKRLNRASYQLSSLPGSLKTFAVDVRKVSDCEAAIRAVCEAFGRLDVLVNSAGVWAEGNSAESLFPQTFGLLPSRESGAIYRARRSGRIDLLSGIR